MRKSIKTNLNYEIKNVADRIKAANDFVANMQTEIANLKVKYEKYFLFSKSDQEKKTIFNIMDVTYNKYKPECLKYAESLAECIPEPEKNRQNSIFPIKEFHSSKDLKSRIEAYTNQCAMYGCFYPQLIAATFSNQDTSEEQNRKTHLIINSLKNHQETFSKLDKLRPKEEIQSSYADSFCSMLDLIEIFYSKGIDIVLLADGAFVSILENCLSDVYAHLSLDIKYRHLGRYALFCLQIENENKAEQMFKEYLAFFTASGFIIERSPQGTSVHMLVESIEAQIEVSKPLQVFYDFIKKLSHVKMPALTNQDSLFLHYQQLAYFDFSLKIKMQYKKLCDALKNNGFSEAKFPCANYALISENAQEKLSQTLTLIEQIEDEQEKRFLLQNNLAEENSADLVRQEDEAIESRKALQAARFSKRPKETNVPSEAVPIPSSLTPVKEDTPDYYESAHLNFNRAFDAKEYNQAVFIAKEWGDKAKEQGELLQEMYSYMLRGDCFRKPIIEKIHCKVLTTHEKIRILQRHLDENKITSQRIWGRILNGFEVGYEAAITYVETNAPTALEYYEEALKIGQELLENASKKDEGNLKKQVAMIETDLTFMLKWCKLAQNASIETSEALTLRKERITDAGKFGKAPVRQPFSLTKMVEALSKTNFNEINAKGQSILTNTQSLHNLLQLMELEVSPPPPILLGYGQSKEAPEIASTMKTKADPLIRRFSL